jgi:MFS family permease
MQPSTAIDSGNAPVASNGAVRSILGYVYFTFICYLSIGLPLAVLPAYVHLHMGLHAALAGLIVSIQYIATFLSRPWAGRISDTAGARVAVVWGMAACAVSGLLLMAAVVVPLSAAAIFITLVASRLALGVGESLGSTGSTLWGITSAGPEHTAKVISYNGVATYGGLALGAPVGVILYKHLDVASLGLLTALLGGVSLWLALRKRPLAITPGEHLPFRAVLSRVAPHGMALALGGLGYSVLATIVTLYYISRHWNENEAALCLTAFGVAFITARLLLIQTINRFGGFAVCIVCMAVESVGVLLIWLAGLPGSGSRWFSRRLAWRR